MEPAAPEKLLKAFQILDSDGKGFIQRDYISKLMMEEGEPFSQDELDEMMAIAVDSQTNRIPYELYINQLMVE
uniref:EF-hand domain-containing protein n=2 Tax=Lutzomyia longipalpis TaxID=7200 RepID=A0A1B0CDA9_LUTLO